MVEIHKGIYYIPHATAFCKFIQLERSRFDSNPYTDAPKPDTYPAVATTSFDEVSNKLTVHHECVPQIDVQDARHALSWILGELSLHDVAELVRSFDVHRSPALHKRENAPEDLGNGFYRVHDTTGLYACIRAAFDEEYPVYKREDADKKFAKYVPTFAPEQPVDFPVYVCVTVLPNMIHVRSSKKIPPMVLTFTDREPDHMPLHEFFERWSKTMDNPSILTSPIVLRPDVESETCKADDGSVEIGIEFTATPEPEKPSKQNYPTTALTSRYYWVASAEDFADLVKAKYVPATAHRLLLEFTSWGRQFPCIVDFHPREVRPQYDPVITSKITPEHIELLASRLLIYPSFPHSVIQKWVNDVNVYPDKCATPEILEFGDAYPIGCHLFLVKSMQGIEDAARNVYEDAELAKKAVAQFVDGRKTEPEFPTVLRVGSPDSWPDGLLYTWRLDRLTNKNLTLEDSKLLREEFTKSNCGTIHQIICDWSNRMNEKYKKPELVEPERTYINLHGGYYVVRTKEELVQITRDLAGYGFCPPSMDAIAQPHPFSMSLSEELPLILHIESVQDSHQVTQYKFGFNHLAYTSQDNFNQLSQMLCGCPPSEAHAQIATWFSMCNY